MNKYNSQKIEKKWLKTWEREGIYKVKDSVKGKKNFYHLVMFPYPSGDLHIGHWYNFGPADIYARFKKMTGYNVLSPIGFDAFGLPAENAAIKRGIHPKIWTYKNIKTMTDQLKQMGNIYDWSRQVITADPEYYKWTQWMFLQLYKNGLAYKKKAPANWCPKDKTVLANEQVVDGKCERCGTEVVQKEIDQWLFKITDYAEKLLNDLDGLDWPEKTKIMQRNWIGKSEGALVKFKVESGKLKATTRETFGFQPYLVPLVLSGEKYISYRLIPKDVKVGDVMAFINSQTKERYTFAKITKIEVKKAKELSEKEPGHEKFKTRKEFYDTYCRYYGTKVTDNTDIWLYHFELVPEHIEVFTTRLDTIFGCTYLVVAPENKIISNLKSQISNFEEVEKYIDQAKKKIELERMMEDKEKTGVELKGVKAINPFTNQEVPVFVADYVLGNYGTGAVMAVPAHDKRDFEFAKKYKLSVKNAIEPITGEIKENEEKRSSIVAIVEDPKNGKLLSINWGGKLGGNLFIGGGLKEGESALETAIREIKEETGYKNIKLISTSEKIHHHYFAFSKNVAREIEAVGFYFKLTDEERVSQKLEDNEKDKFSVEWISRAEAEQKVKDPLHKYLFEKLINGKIYVDDGILGDSGNFNGLSSEKAREEMGRWLEKNNFGKRAVNYKLRDWLVSRQRYWGSPIPIVYCEKCGEVAVLEKDLPVKLPDVKKYLPTEEGKSPLAHSEKFLKAKCPKCGGKAIRETDTMDTFVCSSWYYLRYADPKNKNKFADAKKIKSWLPVDMYIGGPEHATMHLLYVRFFTKALKDFSYLNFNEPITALRHQGMILGSDGQKMSKSRGNVVDPDGLVGKFGADAVKMYLAFMGPYDQGGPWNPTGILGIRRFLDRVYRLAQNYADNAELRGRKIKQTQNYEAKELEKILHQTIKKVGEDIEGFKFNTAISSLMVLLNKIEENPHQLSNEGFGQFVKLLSPFAPFLTEEIWQQLEEKENGKGKSKFKSVHNEKWPKYNPKMIIEDKFNLVVQVNGKVRDSIGAKIGISEGQAKELALKSAKVSGFIGGKEIKKVIYVKDRLINIVIS